MTLASSAGVRHIDPAEWTIKRSLQTVFDLLVSGISWGVVAGAGFGALRGGNEAIGRLPEARQGRA